MQKSYETKRLRLLPSEQWLAQAVTDYFTRNREYLRETEPEREEEFFTHEFQHQRLKQDAERAKQGQAYRFWITTREGGEVIGAAALNNVVLGAFCAAHLSFRLDARETNHELMVEALREIIRIAFEELGLHRLESNVLPGDKAALKVAGELGFAEEGVARQYRRINGVWEDHVHLAILNEGVQKA